MNKLKNQFGKVLSREELKNVVGGVNVGGCDLLCCGMGGADPCITIGTFYLPTGKCSADWDCVINFEVPADMCEEGQQATVRCSVH